MEENMIAGSDYTRFVCILLPWRHIVLHRNCRHKKKKQEESHLICSVEKALLVSKALVRRVLSDCYLGCHLMGIMALVLQKLGPS